MKATTGIDQQPASAVGENSLLVAEVEEDESESTSTSHQQQPTQSAVASFAQKLFGKKSKTSSSSNSSIPQTPRNVTIPHDDKIDEDEKRYKDAPLVFALPTGKKSVSSATVDKKAKVFVETNLEDYLFNFQQLFTDRTMFRSFYRYLETEHNTEPLEFITKVNELEFTYYKMMKSIRELHSNSKEQLSDKSPSALTPTNTSAGVTPTTSRYSLSMSHIRGPFSEIPKLVMGLHQNKSPAKHHDDSTHEPITPRKVAKKQLSFFGIGRSNNNTPVTPSKETITSTDVLESATPVTESEETSEKPTRLSLRLNIFKKSSKKLIEEEHPTSSQSNPSEHETTTSTVNHEPSLSSTTPEPTPSPSDNPESCTVAKLQEPKTCCEKLNQPEKEQHEQTLVTETLEKERLTMHNPSESQDSLTSFGDESPSLLHDEKEENTKEDNHANISLNNVVAPAEITVTQATPRLGAMPKLNLELVKHNPQEKTPSQDDTSGEEVPNGLNRLMTVLSEKKEKKKDELTVTKKKVDVRSPEEDERSDSSNGSTRVSGEKMRHNLLNLPATTPRSKFDSIIKLYKKQILLAIQIMKDFVEEESKKEINISSKDKKTFTALFVDSKQYQNFDEWLLSQPPHLLFRTVKNSVMYELENDNFPRFVRSEIWLRKLQQKGLVYLKKIGRLKEATIFPYADVDFKDHMVYDKDIEFMEYLARDDYQWKLLGSKKEGAINVYKITEKNIFPNVSFYQKMQVNKWTGVLPYPFDVVKKCCMPGLHVYKYDPNITSCEELNFFDFETLKKMYPNEKFKRGPRSVGVVRYGVEFPFPFKSKRSFLSACSAWYDKSEQKLTLIYKPCDHERYFKDGKGVNEGKKLIDIRDFQYYQIKKLDSYRTNILQIHLLDVGGNARFAANMLRMDRAKGMMKGFNDYIRKNMNSIPLISEDDPVWKHVRTCMTRVLLPL